MQNAYSAGLTITRPDGTVQETVGAIVNWAAGPVSSFGSSFDASLRFSAENTARLSIRQSTLGLASSKAIELSGGAGGPLEGVDTITSVWVGDMRLSGTAINLINGQHGYNLAESGASDGTFSSIIAANEIRLDLAFKNGDTGALIVNKPAEAAELRQVLFPQFATGTNPLLDILERSTESQGQ